MKNIYLLFLLFFGLKFYTQNNISSDSIYLNIDEFKFEEFKDVNIKGFTFQNPTLNLELPTRTFQSKTNNYFDINQKLKGKVKKISTYIKRSYEKEKKLITYTVYDKNGLKTLTNESGYINTYFSYDSNNLLSTKTRIVRTDTVYNYNYEYNKINQLTKFSNFAIEYDSLHRPILAKSINPDGQYKLKIVYDNNVVKLEEIYNDKSSGTKEYVYSENNNLIKEVFSNYNVFYCYNKNNLLIKSVTFIDNKLNNIQKFSYDKNDNINSHIFQFAIDKKNGTKAENTNLYKYDNIGNKIYELDSGNITKSTTEYFYEIEYY